MYTDYLPRKIKRRKIVLTVSIALILLFLVFIFNSSYSLGHFYESVSIEDVSCHYAREGNALPTVDENFFPSSNSIFFHDTSCQGRLNSRQACAIESAARTHTNWEIHVLFSAPVNKLSIGDVNIELLSMMKNVKFSRVHIVDYARNTPLEELVNSGAINRTLWPIKHTKDVLKYLSLYKWGGIVIDLDTIVTKPLDALGKNWAIEEKQFNAVRSEAFAFHRDSVGTLIADVATRTLAREFDVVWGGSRVITDSLHEICSTELVADMTPENCLDFHVQSSSVLFTLDLNHEDDISNDAYQSSDIYIYHIQNQRSHHKVDKDSIYAKLAKRYCPIIYENYRDLFGM